MKKSIYKLVQICLVFALLVMSLSSFVGCSNEFAKQEYSNNEIIAKNADRNSMMFYAFTEVDNKLTLKINGFDGRKTLWNKTFAEEKEYNIEMTLSLSSGKAKIVFVDDRGMVITLLENSAEETNNTVTFSDLITFTSGQNRLKLVGYDCKNVNLTISFEKIG